MSVQQGRGAAAVLAGLLTLDVAVNSSALQVCSGVCREPHIQAAAAAAGGACCCAACLACCAAAFCVQLLNSNRLLQQQQQQQLQGMAGQL
jgi:hypothetical protein